MKECEVCLGTGLAAVAENLDLTAEECERYVLCTACKGTGVEE